MEFLGSFELTLQTLLLVSAVPFIWFGYHIRYWWNPARLKTFDVIYTALVLGAASVILAKFATEVRGMDPDLRLLGALHLSPLVLGLMCASFNRGLIGGRARIAAPQQTSVQQQPQDEVSAFKGTVDYVGWDELIIDDSVKSELQSVVTLLKDPRAAQRYGIQVPKGIVLSGPPGTGKTTVAKVIASTAGMSFFALRLDEVISKWVGDSEKNLSRLFESAKKHSPSVIFIDEIDSVGRARSGAQPWADNLVNHLLQLIDGVIRQEGIYIVAATNRLDLVDPALIRGGRLSKQIEIPLPDMKSRHQLFSLFLSKLHLHEGLDLHKLAEITSGRSGADIREICNRAGLNAFKRESHLQPRQRDYRVTFDDLSRALEEVLLGGAYAHTGN